MHWENMTCESAIERWDAGQPVWSCSMGGLGPGYEQCIQIMGFEMLRAMLAEPFDYATKGDDQKAWRTYVDQIDATPNVSAAVEKLGPSGAQHGAAMNIASVFARNGYAKGMELVPKDRRIQVSKNFPTL